MERNRTQGTNKGQITHPSMAKGEKTATCGTMNPAQFCALQMQLH